MKKRDILQEYKDMVDIYNHAHKRIKKLVHDRAYSFNISRAIIGMQGVGKTYLIVKKLLPKINNYFVITSTEKAYAHICPRDKYTGGSYIGGLKEIPKNFIHHTTKEQIEQIQSIIIKNPHRTYIFDDSARYLLDKGKWFKKLHDEYKFNFILVFQGFQSYYKWTRHFPNIVDYFYLFPAVDHMPTRFMMEVEPDQCTFLERYKRKKITPK